MFYNVLNKYVINHKKFKIVSIIKEILIEQGLKTQTENFVGTKKCDLFL